MTRLVSVRIDEETLIEAKRLNLNLSNIMRESLSNEIAKMHEKEFLESLCKIHKILINVDKGQILEELRRDRDKR